MKKIVLYFTVFALACSCNRGSKAPDVSGIKVHLETQRFERDFFAIDTNQVAASLQALLKKYPDFLPDFTYNILGLDLDSLLMPGHPQAKAICMFIHDYQPIKDSAEVAYKDFSRQTESIRKGLQFVKYYFPRYRVPESVITFIGPVNANFITSFGIQGDVLTTRSFGIGLQLHMGKDFSFYKSVEGQEQYPAYISNNFDAAHIPVNCMKNIIDDMYPGQDAGKSLIEQIVDRGRRMYLLTKFLPFTPEYICIGYTDEQLKGCYKNEALIWNFFLNNEMLHTIDADIIKNYIGESPKTPELGDNAPGNIGTFAGLQIVKKFVEKYPGTTLAQLMKMEPSDIYAQSKYKPRA